MAKTFLDQLKETHPNHLAQVVRADVGCPAFQISDWSVRSLSDKGVINPDGLFVIEGHGVDLTQPSAGQQSWSVVVKCYPTREDEAPPDSIWYSQREVQVFDSRLLERMPGPVRGPRCYRVAQAGDGWLIWMERVKDESPERWTLDHYRKAARALGRWNGRCWRQKFMPEVPWMGREHYRQWLAAGALIPGWREYSNPLLRKALAPQDFERACQLYDGRERYIAALNSLPQVFSHFDFHRRNLMFQTAADGEPGIVAIDWAEAGIGPLGGDLYSLLGAGIIVFEMDPETLPELEGVVYPEYLAGLSEEEWNGNPNEIRLAYTAWLALWLGAVGPALIQHWTNPSQAERVRTLVNCEQEELALGWGAAVRFALDRADEALRLMESR